MKKTIIVWDYDTFFLQPTAESGTINDTPAHREFSDKVTEMLQTGEMIDQETDGDLDSAQIKTNLAHQVKKATAIKYFTNELSAQEWVDFNIEFANKYSLNLLSHRIVDI